MSPTETAIASSVVAVYPDHATAERAVRQLHESGFNLGDLSIVGRDSQETEEPYGLVSRGDYVKAGAETGALFGWLFGLCIGAGFLVLPEIGLVVVAGPIAAALLAGIEGALAGTAAGQPGGRARRLGCSERPGTQVREAGQGGQVSRLRPVHPRGRRPRPQPARHPRAGPHRSLRAAGILNPDSPPCSHDSRIVDLRPRQVQCRDGDGWVGRMHRVGGIHLQKRLREHPMETGHASEIRRR